VASAGEVVFADLHDHLAHVGPGEERVEGQRREPEPVEDLLAPVQEPGIGPLAELGDALVEAVPVVEGDEPLHAAAPRDQVEVVGGAWRAALVVVDGDRPAQHHPTVHVQSAEHGIEHGAADVVEEHVDAVGAELDQLALEVGGAVVDAPVEAELVDDPRALLVGSGDADDPTAHDPRDLPHDRPGRPRGRRHDDRLTRLGLADVEQPEIGGHPGRTEDAHHGPHVGDVLELGRVQVVSHDVEVLPPGERRDDVADLVGRAATLYDAADPAAPHDLADLDGRQVALAPVEPGAHGGVDAQVHGAHQRLALGQLGHGRLDELEIGVVHEPDRSVDEPYLPIDVTPLVAHGPTLDRGANEAPGLPGPHGRLRCGS
jgi:hypothetical protein